YWKITITPSAGDSVVTPRTSIISQKTVTRKNKKRKTSDDGSGEAALIPSRAPNLIAEYTDPSPFHNTPLQVFFEHHILVPPPRLWEGDLQLILQELLRAGHRSSHRNSHSQTLLHTIASSPSATLSSSLFTSFFHYLQTNDPTFPHAIAYPAPPYNRTPLHSAIFNSHTDLALSLIATLPPGAQRRALVRGKTNTNSTVVHVAASRGVVEFLTRLVERPEEFSLTSGEVGEMLRECCTLPGGGSRGSTAVDMAEWRIRPGEGRGGPEVFMEVIDVLRRAGGVAAREFGIG
ncbi:hypothetical protein HDV00_012350, partial [Rhizophlyctis rosea]